MGALFILTWSLACPRVLGVYLTVYMDKSRSSIYALLKIGRSKVGKRSEDIGSTVACTKEPSTYDSSLAVTLLLPILSQWKTFTEKQGAPNTFIGSTTNEVASLVLASFRARPNAGERDGSSGG